MLCRSSLATLWEHSSYRRNGGPWEGQGTVYLEKDMPMAVFYEGNEGGLREAFKELLSTHPPNDETIRTIMAMTIVQCLAFVQQEKEKWGLGSVDYPG